MNNTETREILDKHVRQWEQRGYEELSRLTTAKHIETFEQTGAGGTFYQIEIRFFWDVSSGGAIRVFGAIDDGGITAYVPLCSDTLVDPNP